MDLYRSVRAYMDEQKLFDSVNKLIELSFSAYEPYVGNLKELLLSEENLPRLRQKIKHMKFDPDFVQALGEGTLFGLRNAFLVGAQQIYNSLGMSKTIALKDSFEFDWTLFDERARSWMKVQAFTIAGVENLSLLNAVQEELVRAIETGITFNQWRDVVDDLFDRYGVTRLGRHHLYTVYQTNLHSAYNAGRFYAMTDPEVADEFPNWEYIAVLDDKTRPSHAAMHGKVYPKDDPIWAEWYPPNGYNCRCTVVPVHRSEGVKKSRWRPIEGPDEGFEMNPATTTNIFEKWMVAQLISNRLSLSSVSELYDRPAVQSLRTIQIDKNEVVKAERLTTFENESIKVATSINDAAKLTVQNPAEVWGWLEEGNAKRLYIRPVQIAGKKKYGVAVVENLELKKFELRDAPPKRKGFLLFSED